MRSTSRTALPLLSVLLFTCAPPVGAGHFAHAEASAHICLSAESCNPILSDWAPYRSDDSYFYYST